MLAPTVVLGWLGAWLSTSPSWWAVGVPHPAFWSWSFLAHSVLTITTALYQLSHCPFLAFDPLHCSVPSGTALALPNLEAVEQMDLLQLGELRYHPCLVLFTGIPLQSLLPELLFSWPWPCLVGLDYPCVCCRTCSTGWVVATWRQSEQVLEFCLNDVVFGKKTENYLGCM